MHNSASSENIKRIVIALGGNALGNNPEEQKKLLTIVLMKIIPFIKRNYEVIITHGNGPQVGMINLAFEKSFNNKEIPLMPITECTAMSQGYIGFHIEYILRKLLQKEKIKKEVVTVLTEVEVDIKDNAFKNPTKPIGAFYTKEESINLAKSNKNIYIEDAGRGYRKVVASPIPLKIFGIKTIDCLLKNNHIVIACGGGGIPVSKNKEISAVIDKDLASSLLAKELKADLFIVLTNISNVFLNYNNPNALALEKIKVNEIEKYLKENHFAKGSMYPKVQAAINFTKATGNKSYITDINNLNNILYEKNCTVIYK